MTDSARPQLPADLHLQPLSVVEDWRDRLHDFLRSIDEGNPWVEGEKVAREFMDKHDGLRAGQDDFWFRAASTDMYFTGGQYAGRAGYTGDALDAFRVAFNHVFLERIKDVTDEQKSGPYA